MPSEPVHYGQFKQDLYVATMVFPGKRNGFYLEMGAGDGIWISNTLLLEREYGWTGILIEPTSAFEQLKQNRPNSICDNSCVASAYKTVTMTEILDAGQARINPAAGENLLLSQVVSPDRSPDPTNEWARPQRAISCNAVPLQHVLRQYHAPTTIDYFSLDVEGYEYEILRAFPFEEYEFLCMTVERPSPELDQLLRANGYRAHRALGQDMVYLGSRYNGPLR